MKRERKALPAKIPKKTLLHMYRIMVRIRRFEETVRDLSLGGKMPGFVHVSIGEEAAAAGVCAVLTDRDYITSTHRGHGHLIAKGGRTDAMMAEIFGRATGYCKGKGGSMHIADFSLGILGANGIVGAGLPIATGAALAAQLRGTGEVAVCFFGDGASNEGTFHEALNLAAVWKLPVVFMCQNNTFNVFTRTDDVTAVENIADRASSYSMPGVIIDGNSVFDVYKATVEAVARCKAGEGPTLIEAKTYRWEGHVVGDDAFLGGHQYRLPEEVVSWKKRCPIARFEETVLKNKSATKRELDTIQAEIKAEMEASVKFALESPFPKPEDALEDLFSNP